MLTSNYEYSCSNRENLLLLTAIQMKLSEKSKTFSPIFIAFLESALNFKLFEKNEPHSSSISHVIGSEQRA